MNQIYQKIAEHPERLHPDHPFAPARKPSLLARLAIRIKYWWWMNVRPPF